MNEIKKITISLKKGEQEKTAFLMKHFTLDSEQDLLRNLLNTKYAEVKENILKYGTSERMIKRDETLSKLSELKAMNDYDLTQYLYGVGFEDFAGPRAVSDGEDINEKDTMVKYDLIVTTATGRSAVQYHYLSGDPTKKISYSADMMSLDKLLEKLLKEKYIK